jgi:hypothetical protein
MMMNENINVSNCEANGTMCKFKEVVLAKGVAISDLEKIVIDGYYVWCASESQVESLKLELMDGHKGEIFLKSHGFTGTVDFPLPIFGDIGKYTERWSRSFKMHQFSLNAANARTIHKLQGRSLKSVVISSWDYKGSWVYVALSRVCSMNQMFLRLPLDISKCEGMSHDVRQFMEEMRTKKFDVDI